MNRVDSALNEPCNGNPMPEADNPAKQQKEIGDSSPPRSRASMKENNPLQSSPKKDQQATPSSTPPSQKQTSSSKQRTSASTSPNRKSVESSEKSGTTGTSQKRKRRPASKQPSSSHRTAVTTTAVDPSRPARHYRIRSSATAPTASRDLDDPLALHFRSCSLFQNPGYFAPHPSISPGGGIGGGSVFGGSGRHGTDSESPHYYAPPGGFGNPAPTGGDARTNEGHYFVGNFPTPSSPSGDPQSEDIENVSGNGGKPERPCTVIHWSSATRRRKEYEEIDRSNSGVRCFIRKITPRCVSGPPPQRFHGEGGKKGGKEGDGGSVRRYRMEIEETDHEGEEEEEREGEGEEVVDEKRGWRLSVREEKSTALSSSSAPASPSKKGKSRKIFGCF